MPKFVNGKRQWFVRSCLVDLMWAMSWENLFMPYENNKDAGQPAHSRSLISAFVIRCIDSIKPLVSTPKISSTLLVVAEQAGLSLIWSQTSKTGFVVTWLIWQWCTEYTITFIGPRQANLVLIAYASSEGSGEPAHPCSLARTYAAPSYRQWVKRNLQTENQIPSPSEWLGMRS